MKFNTLALLALALLCAFGIHSHATDHQWCATKTAQAYLDSTPTISRVALSWETLSARLSPVERRRLEAVRYGFLSSSRRQMLNAFRAGDWEAPIFFSDKAPQLALSLYRAGKITQSQFVTHQSSWAARLEFGNATALRLEGPEGMALARDIFTGHTHTGRRTAQLSSDKVEELLGKLSALPVSERVLFVVHTEPTVQDNPRLDHADTIFRSFMGIHFPTPGRGPRALVIPSFSILQLYLDAVHGERAVQLIPEFGVATVESILAQVAGHGRCIVVPFPGVEGVEAGDGMYFGKTYAYVHDFYHADRGSSGVLPSYGALFPLIVQAMKNQRDLFVQANALWVRDQAISDLINLEPESRSLFEYGPEPSALDCFEHDFGAGNGRVFIVARAVLKDMERYPERWRASGVNIENWRERLTRQLP